MTKDIPTKGGTELIVYQISEVKNLLENYTIKSDKFQEGIDKRVSALELWQAGELVKGDHKPTAYPLIGEIDTGKIVLLALTIASTALAIIQGQGLIK